MKRIIVVCVLLLVALSFSFGDFSFSLFSKDTLYKPYYADSFNAMTRFEYLTLINSYGPSQILATVERETDVVYENDPVDVSKRENVVMEKISFQEADKWKKYLRMKVGTTIGLLRFEKGIFKAEFNLQGALNLVFNAKSHTDLIGFDGIYFLGFNISLFDNLKIRTGMHHYSGHYGDEIMEEFFCVDDQKGRLIADRKSYPWGTPGHITRLVDYVGQDSLLIGLSYEFDFGLRLYAEADILPFAMNAVRPWMLCPEGRIGLDSEIKNDPLDDWVNQTENHSRADRKAPYKDAYQGLAFNVGAEFRTSFGLNLGFDARITQEGQTLYQIGAFSSDNPWTIDYNVVLGQEFGSESFKAEVVYHSGRFPLTNFFWHPCQYVSVGFSYLI